MYAVISTGGKQYKLNQGDIVEVERIDGDVGEKIVFDNVLCLGEDENLQVGSPTVDGAKVVGTILDQKKGNKITVFKFKRRKMYRRKQGHRQLLTKVQIESIEGSDHKDKTQDRKAETDNGKTSTEAKSTPKKEKKTDTQESAVKTESKKGQPKKKKAKPTESAKNQSKSKEKKPETKSEKGTAEEQQEE